MKRLFGGIYAGLALGTAGFAVSPGHAQSAAADQPEAIVCQLLDNCNEGTPAAAAPGEKPRPVRRGEVRGFSLARPTSPAGQTQAPAAAPAGPARTRVATATPSRPKPAGQRGQYDLRVQFLTGSAEVSPVSQAQVSAFATALKDPRLAGRRVRIEGHTDSTGNATANQDLSQRRAQAIADMLASNGVDTTRLDVKGYGSSRPLPGTSPRNGVNRRVVAVLAN